MIYSPSLEIGNSRDFGEVRAEVHRLVRVISPRHEMDWIDRAFALTRHGCEGSLTGYSALLTPYHDQGHVLEVVLCSARLLHGLHLGGTLLDPLTIDACLIGALLHDAGYLMLDRETAGTGAQYTPVHVARGVVFAEIHLGRVLPADLMRAVSMVILTTDHRLIAPMPDYDNRSQQLAAWVTATADLVGQMANREYLERLLLLYYEFRQAGITFFSDFHDLIEKTEGFYKVMSARMTHELGGLAPHLLKHFDQARGVRRNFYLESIDRNIHYLSSLLCLERERRLDRLKRGGIVTRAVGLLGNSLSMPDGSTA